VIQEPVGMEPSQYCTQTPVRLGSAQVIKIIVPSFARVVVAFWKATGAAISFTSPSNSGSENRPVTNANAVVVVVSARTEMYEL
jgi:hypothetical protein